MKEDVPRISVIENANYKGVTSKNGMLVFKDKASYESLHEQLNRSRKSLLLLSVANKTVEDSLSCGEEEPVLDSLEQALGLYSLRKKYLEQECNMLDAGYDPANIPRCPEVDKIDATFFNSDYQVQIGQEIHWFINRYIDYVVLDGDLQKLIELMNGKHPFELSHVEIRQVAQAKQVGVGNGNEVEACDASFSVQINESSNTGIFFWNGSVPGMVHWIFGDGQDSIMTAAPNMYVTHQYAGDGPYTVSVIYIDSTCTDSSKNTIHLNSCAANFNFTQGINGGINFADISSSSSTITEWKWDFGDGQNQTITQSPGNTYHVYSCEKDYPVTLHIKTSENCTDDVTNTITVKTGACCDKTGDLGWRSTLFNNNNNKLCYNLKNINNIWGQHRTVGCMEHYAKNSNGNWKKTKATLKIELYGDAYITDASNCDCGEAKNVATNGSNYAKTYDIFTNVGQKFWTKKDFEWGGKFSVDNTEIVDVINDAGCH